MTFTVTYRGADGAVREERVEAANRADCFAQCRARGIAPVSVKEGRNGKSAASPAAKGRPREPAKRKLFTILFYLLVAIAAIVAIAWWLARPQAKPPAADPPKSVKPVREAKPKPKPAPKAAEAKPAPAAVATNQAKVAEAPKERHDTVSIHTNNMGKVVEKWIGADGKLHMSVRYARKPVFDNASDDQLAMAVGGGGMQAIPPIPMVAASEQEFLESLKKPIVIADDDPEDVKKLKQAVSEARADMKALMDKGMSYREALAEHQRLVNENVDTRNQCLAELKRLVDEGDRDGAEKYLRTINVALGQMGIPALTMPMSREELNAARQRRKEALEAAKQGKE